MVTTMTPILYRFRPGALDAIARSRRFTTEEQLALYIGVEERDLPKLRAGAFVTAEVALRVSTLQGDRDYISAWFDLVEYPQMAA